MHGDDALIASGRWWRQLYGYEPALARYSAYHPADDSFRKNQRCGCKSL